MSRRELKVGMKFKYANDERTYEIFEVFNQNDIRARYTTTDKHGPGTIATCARGPFYKDITKSMIFLDVV